MASRVIDSEDHTPEGFKWLRLKHITVSAPSHRDACNKGSGRSRGRIGLAAARHHRPCRRRPINSTGYLRSPAYLEPLPLINSGRTRKAGGGCGSARSGRHGGGPSMGVPSSPRCVCSSAVPLLHSPPVVHASWLLNRDAACGLRLLNGLQPACCRRAPPVVHPPAPGRPPAPRRPQILRKGQPAVLPVLKQFRPPIENYCLEVRACCLFGLA